jgi:hypothetical protein
MSIEEILDKCMNSAIQLAKDDGEVYIFCYKNLLGLVNKDLYFNIKNNVVENALKDYMKEYKLYNLPGIIDYMMSGIKEINEETMFEYALYFMMLLRLRCIPNSEQKFFLKITVDQDTKKAIIDENPLY